MKKSLIALAVMAAAGAASAQSSVQLYGIADVYLGSVKVQTADQTGKLVGERNSVVNSGGVDTSRWGLKGSEDLGGGLKANFQLEQAFDVDTGKAGLASDGKTAAFSRIATVGLSGNFGAVTLGKQYTAFDYMKENTFSSFKSQALAAPRYVFGTNAYQANPANTIKYQSNSYSGFNGALSYSLGENKDTVIGGNSASNVVALNGQYANGPIYVGLGYQKEKFVAGEDLKLVALNGSYDFGVAKLLGDFAQGKQGDSKTTDYHIGVDVPLASNLILSGGYAHSKDKTNGVTDEKRNGYGLALAYVLSKRTVAYTGLNITKAKDDAGDTVGKVNAYAVGVKHAF